MAVGEQDAGPRVAGEPLGRRRGDLGSAVEAGGTGGGVDDHRDPRPGTGHDRPAVAVTRTRDEVQQGVGAPGGQGVDDGARGVLGGLAGPFVRADPRIGLG
ncbi:hypothetical protein [Pseudonocardia sp. HH130629-09]|uniref:hypothetical protein n=1 Tax=Pseudonocardia sp. HH130629-09 TaxID=1641402 RepID=UPI00143A6AB2|nr:hypothetical protein [Pseudonocardia sp. HH130629-09]